MDAEKAGDRWINESQKVKNTIRGHTVKLTKNVCGHHQGNVTIQRQPGRNERLELVGAMIDRHWQFFW